LFSLCKINTTGKPHFDYTAVCQDDDGGGRVDKIEYLSDQLSVWCAEVAALQAKAVAATEDAELELESVREGSPLKFQTLAQSQVSAGGTMPVVSCLVGVAVCAALRLVWIVRVERECVT
jgi:hypothetical protein